MDTTTTTTTTTTSTPLLRHFLRRVCHDLHWDYAVFWKLKHCNQMLLTWEDGYCNSLAPREIVKSMLGNVHMGETSGIGSFGNELEVASEISVGYQIELAVETMSCLSFSLGEGYVGRVASTGKHCWVFADDFDSNLIPEYPNELHLQFAVGIKTVLLVPVIPHGVVQLGSLQKVNEDPATLLAHIGDMFNTYNLGEPIFSTLDKDLPESTSSLTSDLLEKIASASSFNILNSVQSTRDDIQVPMGQSRCIPDMTFQFDCQDDLHVLGNNITNTWDAADFGDLPMCSAAFSFLQNQLLVGNHLKISEPAAPGLYCRGEDFQMSSRCDSTEFRLAAHTNVVGNVYSFDGMMDQQFEDGTSEVTDQIIYNGFPDFSTDSELHKVLGLALQQRGNDHLQSEDMCSSSTPIYHTGIFEDIRQLVGKSDGLFGEGGHADSLLDVMVSSMYDASGDISSPRSNNIRSPTNSSEQITASCQTQSRSRCSILGENDSGKTGVVSPHGNVLTRSPCKSSLKRPRSGVIDEEPQVGLRSTQSRKSTKLSHSGQKKARDSDVQKPRPRDRQMIQDRVKELRDIVPNGTKCSIDALLDQTIKHMLFLRSIASRAETLKQCVYPEAVNKRNWKLSENQGPEKGASWAFELGSQSGACPIVVKDLDLPGHMRIEMLCEENGLFLEIAQAIRRLGLTIVKGVMENRLDQSWAHFVVEVSTGFHRLDIFWPLMQLVQQNSSISSMI